MLPYIKNEYWKLYTDFLHISLHSIKHGFVRERERAICKKYLKRSAGEACCLWLLALQPTEGGFHIPSAATAFQPHLKHKIMVEIFRTFFGGEGKNHILIFKEKDTN
jgi:hypothetical protein